jgi:hypothetical protein
MPTGLKRYHESQQSLTTLPASMLASRLNPSERRDCEQLPHIKRFALNVGHQPVSGRAEGERGVA